MRSSVLALLLAVPSLAAGADGAADLLRQAEEQVLRLEGLAGTKDESGWVSPAEAAAYCASSPMTVAAADERDRQLVWACRAYERSDAGECAAMPAAYVSRNSENCLATLEHLVAFTHINSPSAESRRRCENGFGRVNPKLTPSERVAACAALETPGDAAARCRVYREKVPRFFFGVDFNECVSIIQFSTDGTGCEDYHPGSNQRVECAAFAAHRRGSCGRDYLCRALRGEAGACEAGRRALIAAACAASSLSGGKGKPAAPADLRREVEETLAWAAQLPVLDFAGRDSALRLHEMMLGRRALEPARALPDLVALRRGAVEDLLHRAGPSGAADALRRRAETAAAAVAGLATAAARAEQDGLRRCLEAAGAEEPRTDEKAASCASGCTMETILADSGLKSRMFSDVVLRQVCRAVALRAPEPCDVLADIRGNPESGQRMCRRLYLMSLLSRGLADGTPKPGLCEEWCAMAPTTPPAELVGRVCGAILRSDYVRACADIQVALSGPDHGYNVRECHWEMQALLGAGDAEFCARHYRPGSDVCRAAGLYKKGACGGDPLCRAMRKEGLAACSSLDAAILEQARTPAPASADAVREDLRNCARARARTLRRLDEVRSPELDVRQKSLEETFQLRAGISASHAEAAPASYAGGWKFTLGKSEGSVTVDASGRFLLFAGSATLAGSVNLATGELTGMSAEPGGREGRLTGRCASFTECAGTDSLSARFRLTR